MGPGDEQARIRAVNAERAEQRGYIIFATDSTLHPDDISYRQIYATQAASKAQAVAKVRAAADGRRLNAFLITKRYSDELAEASWVA